MIPEKKRILNFFWAVFLLAGLMSLVFSAVAYAAEEKNAPEANRASKIIDETVRNAQGEEVGEVDDMIMSRNGKIKEVVLSVGGFLGTGYRLVAVPFKALRKSAQAGILYDVTHDQLEKHSSFSYRREGFGEYSYSPPPPYGSFVIPPPGIQGYFPYGHLYGSPSKGRYRGEYGAWGWEYYPERMRVSGILKRHIWNEDGQEMGEIDDLMISRNGKVETIILSVGEFLGMEEKLVALPFRPLKVNGAGIVYNVTQQQIKELPGFHYQKR
jgi:sporulation protein YlmC with PRC-barrel domain